MNIQDRMDMIADNPRLIDVKPLHSALQSVLDLHEPKLDTSYDTIGKLNKYCDHCNTEYPCPTVRAIENTLKECA